MKYSDAIVRSVLPVHHGGDPSHLRNSLDALRTVTRTRHAVSLPSQATAERRGRLLAMIFTNAVGLRLAGGRLNSRTRPITAPTSRPSQRSVEPSPPDRTAHVAML